MMMHFPFITIKQGVRTAFSLALMWAGSVGLAVADIENTAFASGSYQGTGVSSDSVVAKVPVAASAPSLILRKGVASITDVNGNSVTDEGDTIEYTFEVTNSGNVSLSDIKISDDLVDVIGGPLVTLAPGVTDTTTFRAVYEITQDDVDAGGVENTAIASAQPPTGPDGIVPDRVQDRSDSAAGDEKTETPDLSGSFDEDPTNDPTVTKIAANLGLVLTKEGVLAAGDDGFAHADDVVTYTFVAENTSNVTLFDVTVVELDSFSGTGSAPTPAYVSGGGDYDADNDAIDLRPGEKASFTATYSLGQDDVDALTLSNQAQVSATSLAGEVTSDVSDSTHEADETGADNDPTVIRYEAAPALSVVKTAGTPVAVFPTIYDITYTIEITNTGNVTQTTVVATDPLSKVLAPARIYGGEQPTVSATGLKSGTANASYNGASDINLLSAGTEIAPNTTAVIEVTVRVDTGPNSVSSSISNFPASPNTVSVTSDQITDPVTSSAPSGLQDSDGDGIADSAESSSADRDGDGISDANDYDPLGYFYCEADGRILSGGRIAIYDSSGALLNDAVGVRNGINIVSDGSSGQYQWLSVGRTGTFRMAITYPNGMTASTTVVDSGTLNIASAENVYTGAIGGAPGTSVPVGAGEFGSTGILSNYAGGPSLRYNRFWSSFVISAFAPNIIGNNIPVENCVAQAPVTAEKSVNKDTVKIGERVTYTLSYSAAALGTATANAQFVDQLPKGISYVPNSATLNGSAVEPSQNGNRLTWTGQSLNAGDSITIRYSAVVGPNAPFGKLTNRTWIADSTGNVISNVARATVERIPEAVFDCSDVIGKVFDDRNANGYQDQGEPGIPSARVVTVRGTRITTDEFGRFHVPCAELPSKIGTNFILKLDERSLPSGYRPTTENPRVVRLTAGKFAKMNFGVALSKVVRVGLTKDAFAANGTPSRALKNGINQLVDRMQETPSVVHLTYFRSTESKAIARQRSKQIEALIRKQWRRRGGYKLNVERTIQDVR